MIPVKDSLEKLISDSTPSVSQTSAAPAKNESGGLRSDAVSLEVLVKVHGSRVAETARDAAPHTEPFEEQCSTMIVFPQGGVLKMSTAVNIGQMLVVTNLKSGQDAICRVVKVRAFANTQSYVEVEFTHRQVGYWGVQFSSDVTEAPKKPASVPAVRVPIAPSAAFEALAPPPAPPVPLSRVSPIPVKPAEPAKAPSPFVGLGAQEDVQIAASPTRNIPGSVAPIDFKTRAHQSSQAASQAESLKQAAPPAAPIVSPVSSPSVEELRGDVQPLALGRTEAREAPDSAADSDEPVLLLEDDSPAVEGSPALAPASAPEASVKAPTWVGSRTLGVRVPWREKCSARRWRRKRRSRKAKTLRSCWSSLRLSCYLGRWARAGTSSCTSASLRRKYRRLRRTHRPLLPLRLRPRLRPWLLRRHRLPSAPAPAMS